jgi:hypothetical protein
VHRDLPVRVAAAVLLGFAAAVTTGCAGLAARAAGGFAEDLAGAIVNQDDPELVRDGLPAYLLLLDSLAADGKPSPAVAGAAARLYAAYAVVFVTDPGRAATLGARARSYGDQALCAAAPAACDLRALQFPEFKARIDALAPKQAAALYAWSVGSLAYVRTHADDFTALAELPKIEAALERLAAIGTPEDQPSVNTFLGVLNTLRPEALGGKPERGREYFERALALAGGKDLSIKVEYARQYGRLVYDRELHDRLLNEVLAADPQVPGYTLFNTLAQQSARDLLASADEYF